MGSTHEQLSKSAAEIAPLAETLTRLISEEIAAMRKEEDAPALDHRRKHDAPLLARKARG